MRDVIIVILIAIALYVVLPVLILIVRDRVSVAIWRRRNPPEKLAEQRREFERRLLNPDWEFYERHLQRPVPEALQELYANRDLIIGMADVADEYGGYISSFEPLDAAALDETRSMWGLNVVPIAGSDGNLIYLEPGPVKPDVVYEWDHETGEVLEVADDLAVFVARLRPSR